jgi:parvulin-like peptidyl-prolyl isomerase
MIQFIALERVRLILAFSLTLFGGLAWSDSTLAQTAPSPNTPSGNPIGPDPALVTPLFFVNNQAVLPEMLDRVRRGNPVFNAKFAGAIGQDFQNLLLDQAILLEVTRQDAAGMGVTEDEVEKFVTDFRAREKLVTEQAYNARLEKLGYTDSSLREIVRESFRLNKRIAQVRDTAAITPVELEFFMKFNREKFAASGVLQDRVLARQIVVQSLETAKEMIKRAKAGADFAALAREFSNAGASRGGAVNNDGSEYPGLVARDAFPEKVANAVFKLSKGGLSDPVRDGANIYVVRVAKFVPIAAQTPMMQPAKTVAKIEAEAMPLKRDQEVENWLEGLRSRAILRFPDGLNSDRPKLEFFNPLVALVGAGENPERVMLADLNRAVYFNPQVAALLSRAGAGSSELLPKFFKVKALENLIDERIAVVGATQENLPFVGSRAMRLEAMLNWQTRALKLTPIEIRRYFDDHIGEFITPASANMLEASFGSSTAASTFRASAVKTKGANYLALAQKMGGQARDMGRVASDKVPGEYQIVFGYRQTKRLSSVRRISGMIERNDAQGKKLYRILLVSNLSSAVVPSYKKARDRVTAKVLEIKRREAGRRWLDTEREILGLQNDFNEVQTELENRARVSETPVEPSSPTPKAPSNPTEPPVTPPNQPVDPNVPGQ